MSKDAETYQISSEFIEITVDEGLDASTMDVYIAYPVAAGNYRGVIVGFELFGMTGHMRNIVERIAQLGYVVIAADFYHRTAPRVELEATADGRARGFALLHQLTRKQALDDVRAAMNYLREEKKVLKIGMVGFSIGGHIAYLAAAQCDLQATVVFYPGWLTGQEIPLSRPTATLALTPGIAEHDGYLLFLVGERDRLIPGEQRESIVRELMAANVRHEFVTYADAPHGFFCDERESFHQVSAEDAWQRLCAVFAAELV